MDKKIASYLLASLVQRINRDQVGSVSDQEKEALAFALQMLSDGVAPVGIASVPLLSPAAPTSEQTPQINGIELEPRKAAPPPLPDVTLMLEAVKSAEPSDKGVLLCLDFGTAMSKAFASTTDGKHLDLELGKAAGKQGYTLPSSVFIDDDGKAYFGFEAIERSGNLKEAGRERLDSIKSWLSLREEGSLDGEMLSEAYNPTPFKLSEGDMIRIYLAFLTDMAGISLSEWTVDGKVVGRYVLRRFARPCGKSQRQAAWVDGLMKRLLAEAQVLADTFHRQWSGGISVGQIKAAIDALKALNQRPDHLIGEGVPEPVAVAAGAVETSENRIDAYMVVDAGAGTTDFGLFFVMRNKSLDEPKVFQIPASIKGLNQAGDKVDQLLQAFIRAKESFDPTSTLGRLVEADLRRRIRVQKEILFTTGKLDYILADSTVGSVTLDEFLKAPSVQQFTKRLEDGFRESLESVDESYLNYLAMDPVRLQVILSGGSSKLTMISALASGYIEVNGKKIRRAAVDAAPEWMADESDEMRTVYPQLAVAIGGAFDELPSSEFGPAELVRQTRPTYVSSNLSVSGN